MAMRTVYGTQPAGAQVPGSTLDAIFLDIFQLGGITQCAASGTNAITLTPTANQAVVTTPLPLNGQRLDFVAAGNSTGSVTVQVGAGTAVPLYRADGTTQVGAGGIVGGTPYQVMFLTALNSGNGGFILLNAGATGVVAGTYGSLVVDASGRLTSIGTIGALINIQKFTGTATYTPTTGTNFVVVEVLAGGGAGGGAPATGAAQGSAGSGGNAGGYARKRITSAFSGVTVTVGAGGTAGAAGAGGNAGGTSSFGALVSCPGGNGGTVVGPVGTAQVVGASALAATPTGGDINTPGSLAQIGFAGGGNNLGGAGAPSQYGAGGGGASNGVGSAGAGFGSGGGGSSNNSNQAALVGGVGAPGLVMVWEYA